MKKSIEYLPAMELLKLYKAVDGDDFHSIMVSRALEMEIARRAAYN